jgi:O-antigen/teichoic acid export membrane protein
VLFPVLTKLTGETHRQLGAFLRACRALALIGVPFCLAEALLAGPAVRVVYGTRWTTAGMLLSLLACSAAINLVASSTVSLMLAQGRYQLNMVWSFANALVFGAAVFAGACWFGALGVAVGGLVTAALVAALRLWQTVAASGGRWRDVARVYLPPILLSATALLPAAAALAVMGRSVAECWVEMVIAGITAPPIYLVLACRFCPTDVAELASHAKPVEAMLRRLRLLPADAAGTK